MASSLSSYLACLLAASSGLFTLRLTFLFSFWLFSLSVSCPFALSVGSWLYPTAQHATKNKTMMLLLHTSLVYFTPINHMDNCIWVIYVQGEEEGKRRTKQKQEEKTGHCCFLQLKRLHKIDKGFDFSLNFLFTIHICLLLRVVVE